jgi:hypothetical protein
VTASAKSDSPWDGEGETEMKVGGSGEDYFEVYYVHPSEVVAT